MEWPHKQALVMCPLTKRRLLPAPPPPPHAFRCLGFAGAVSFVRAKRSRLVLRAEWWPLKYLYGADAGWRVGIDAGVPGLNPGRGAEPWLSLENGAMCERVSDFHTESLIERPRPWPPSNTLLFCSLFALSTMWSKFSCLCLPPQFRCACG